MVIFICDFCYQGARHSFAEAQGKNIANPTAILLCAANMLKHMHLERYGDKIENAVHKVIKAGKVSYSIYIYH